MLCTQVEPSCQGNELSECWSSLEMALHWSDILQLYPIRPDPTEHVELFRQYPTNANILQLTPTAGPHWPDCWRMLALVGECWRLSGQCGSCLRDTSTTMWCQEMCIWMCSSMLTYNLDIQRQCFMSWLVCLSTRGECWLVPAGLHALQPWV